MMNSKLITKAVLLSVAMAGTITSYQKEEFQNEIPVSQEMSQKNLAHQELTLRYWIDGVEYSKDCCICGIWNSIVETAAEVYTVVKPYVVADGNGAVAGAISGALGGAIIGSVVGGVGAVLGAASGFIEGGVGGAVGASIGYHQSR